MFARSFLLCSALAAVVLTVSVAPIMATETAASAESCFASCHQFTERCINTCHDPIVIACAHPSVTTGAGYECVCSDKSTPSLGGLCPKDAAAAGP